MLNGVDTPVAIISQLNTLPALPPVNASMATLGKDILDGSEIFGYD
jgi:hypothetical protein